MRILQDNPNGKMGYWECKNCGLMGSYSDKYTTKNHLSGLGCKKFRKLFGFKGNWKN